MESALLFLAFALLLVGATASLLWFGGRWIRFPREGDSPRDKRLQMVARVCVIGFVLVWLLLWLIE